MVSQSTSYPFSCGLRDTSVWEIGITNRMIVSISVLGENDGSVVVGLHFETALAIGSFRGYLPYPVRILQRIHLYTSSPVSRAHINKVTNVLTPSILLFSSLKLNCLQVSSSSSQSKKSFQPFHLVLYLPF